MQPDIAHITHLLWAILGLLIFLVVSNILCQVFGCSTKRELDYTKLLAKGEYDGIIGYTEKRLKEYPYDKNALYFRAKALMFTGRIDAVKDCVRKLGETDIYLARSSAKWLAALCELERLGVRDPQELAAVLSKLDHGDADDN